MNLKRLAKTVVLYIAFAFYQVSAAFAGAPVMFISDVDQEIDLNPYVQFIEDKSNSMSIEDIQAGVYEELWQDSYQKHFSGTSTESRYWFRVGIRFNKDFAEEKPTMYFKNHPILLVDLNLWVPNNNGDIEKIKSGYLGLKENDDIDKYQFGIKMPTNKGAFTVVGLVDNRATEMLPLLPMFLVSEKSMSSISQKSTIFMSLFYGMMLALILYNLGLFVTLKQALNGYYVLFLISASLLCAFMDGLLLELLPFLSYHAHFKLNLLIGTLLNISYLLFLWSAFGQFKYSRSLKASFQVLVILGCLLIGNTLFSPWHEYSSLLDQAYASFVIVFSIAAIAYGVVGRVVGAGFFVLAECSILIGGSLTILFINGFVVFSDLVFWSLHLGFLGEALLLSFAMAARTNIGIRDQMVAQNLVLEHERKAHEALEIATNAKNEFLATISHELRTPLTSIIGFSEAILEDTSNIKDIESHTNTILRSGKNLLTVIDDVLKLSLIENNKVSVRKKPVNILPMLDYLQNKYKYLTQQKNIEFNMLVSPLMPEVFELDDENLIQVLGQLLDNAVKFTKTGSIQLELSYDKDDGELVFKIKDTGIGIDEDKLHLIFHPFTQGDSSDSRSYGGTGIGLFVAKSVTEQMDGHLFVDSTPNVGTTVTFAIPADVSTEDQEVDSTHFSAPPSSTNPTFPIMRREKPSLTGRVLYAEDNVDNQDLVKLLVEATGAELVLVDNGELALQAMADEIESAGKPFDLVFMDLQMPVMDGRTSAIKLREQGFDGSIIAFSASALSEIEVSEYNPFSGYLAKPIKTHKLYDILEECLASVESKDTEFPQQISNQQ